MFTGIVTAVGTVRTVKKTPKGLTITIAAPYRGLAEGDSIAVDGACLTVVRVARGTFTVQAVTTTRGRTNFGAFRPDRRVNLERALRVGERLGGHLVSGHVDGVGQVVRRRVVDDAVLLDIRVPRAVAALSVPHGSICVEGVSLTINEMPRPGVVQVSLIPYTLEVTTLGRAKAGTRLHLEADLVGKFVMQGLAPYRTGRRRPR
jgi:riboflavin synthase